MRRLLSLLYRSYLNFKYRSCDPGVCCCGSDLGTGGSICYHGGCRSMKEYVITADVERRFHEDS